jgi:methionyl-tRNA synthetase
VGIDPLRYQLVRDVALGSDGDFSFEGLLQRYNSDLANNLGNLLQRVSTVVGSKCDGVGPAPTQAEGDDDEYPRLASVAAEVCGWARDAWDRWAPNEALEAPLRLVRETNSELEAREPWKMAPGPEVEAVLGDALEVLRIVAILVAPAMPAAADEIWRRIGLTGSPGAPGVAAIETGELEWGRYPGGLTVEHGDPLFPRRKE